MTVNRDAKQIACASLEAVVRLRRAAAIDVSELSVSGAGACQRRPAPPISLLFHANPSTRVTSFSVAAKNSDLTAIGNLLFVHAIAV